MQNKLIKKIATYFAIGSFILAGLYPIKSNADDIAKGMRGPTLWQIDERINYSRNEKGLETVVNDNIFKYWDGKKFGKVAILNIPYKKFNNVNGIGDITLLLGPRATIKNLHLIPYTGLTFPTANYKNKIGNGRYDLKEGLMLSYLIPNIFEVHGIIQYNFTGKNKKRINPANEFYSGFVAGRNITKKLKGAVGPTINTKTNGDYLVNLRSVFKYNFSKRWFVEIVGTKNILNCNIPKVHTLEFQLRYNPGRINN